MLKSSGKIQAKKPQEVKKTPSQNDLDLIQPFTARHMDLRTHMGGGVQQQGSAVRGARYPWNTAVGGGLRAPRYSVACGRDLLTHPVKSRKKSRGAHSHGPLLTSPSPQLLRRHSGTSPDIKFYGELPSSTSSRGSVPP